MKWGDAGAEYAIESTGVFTAMEDLGSLEGWSQEGHHLCPFCDSPMFVMGVKHDKYDDSLKIVSNDPAPPTAWPSWPRSSMATSGL